MAKKRKTPAQPGQDWNAPAAELLAAAVAAVVEIDAAIMRGDGAAAEAASDRYEAVIWKMNGGTHVGSMADHDAPGQVIERYCAAVPGDVPLWGQRGQFLVADGDIKIKAARAAGLNAKGKGAGPERDPASPQPTMTCSTVKADDAAPVEGGPVSPETTMPSSGAESCSIARISDGGPADLVEFKPGQRCEIVSVHHPVFNRYIGKRIIIVKVHPDTRQVWAHDDRPITYKTNRAGRRVVDSDPSCIQSIYGFDQLRLIT